MNAFAQILVLTAHLWHPAALMVLPADGGIFQHLRHSLSLSRLCERRPHPIDEELFLRSA